jgi:dihydropteroate synthase
MNIPTALRIGQQQFNWGEKTYIMGVLNITPDSFSGDGLIQTEHPDTRGLLSRVLSRAQKYIAAGVHIIDVGGESTRPGAQPVTEAEEYNRVVPVIKTLAVNLDVVISIDTYRAGIARAALQAGAHMVNDVWGLHADPEMAHVVAQSGAPVILMHNRSSWAHAEVKERLGGRYIGLPYGNLLLEIKQDLIESINLARQAGISDEKIILDPGIGFGKTVEQNLELLDRLGEIRELGFPILFGPSRKSFIGYTLNLPPHKRLEGTAAAVSIGVAHGADIIRVHDVAFMSRVARMADAITRRTTASSE